MPLNRALVFLVFLLVPAVASGQSTFVYGSAGPTITDSGHSLAIGVGFSPASRLTLVANLDRTHLASRIESDGQVVSAFRGGTTTLAAAEVRVALRDRHHVAPYVLCGLGTGLSRPNVNENFPDAVTHRVRAPFCGGGVHVPVRGHLSAFADARMMFVVGVDSEEFGAVMPVRAGIAWRF